MPKCLALTVLVVLKTSPRYEDDCQVSLYKKTGSQMDFYLIEKPLLIRNR